ncbi:hypothetical protein [Blastococcus sp. URHD0036]|uniref:hypothetical protein n=1 Tax=Blastococcus sp. URHD0036 TaxID=1380356 RepID=UPI00049675B8|nr:hypothetical protein [Blastococcus sp. URHD0036]
MTSPAPAVAAGTPPGDTPERARRGTTLPAVALLPLAAAVWWIGGFLGWLLTQAARGDAGNATALPLDPSGLGGLVVGGLVGGVAAGLLTRLAARRRWGLAATAGGVAIAVVVTLAQSSAVVRDAAAGTFAADPAVLTGLMAVAGGAAAAGWLAGACALLGSGGPAVGLGLLAGLAPSWVSAVVFAVSGPQSLTTLDRVATWSGAAVLALALVVAGVRPPQRLLWWPLVVVLAWFAGPALTAVVYLEPLLRPGAGLPDTLFDSLSGAWQVFEAASSPDARDLVPWGVAGVTAAVVAGALAARRVSGAAPPAGGRAG